MSLTLAKYDFRAVHDVALKLVRADRRAYQAFTGEEFDATRYACQSLDFGPLSWVGYDDSGTPQFAGGFLYQRPHRYRTWFLSTPECWRLHAQATTELVRNVITATLADGARRIECWTLASCTRARNWYGTIGLSHEATLRGYGASGEDAVIYVALSENP